jgi:hypothetical protein
MGDDELGGVRDPGRSQCGLVAREPPSDGIPIDLRTDEGDTAVAVGNEVGDGRPGHVDVVDQHGVGVERRGSVDEDDRHPSGADRQALDGVVELAGNDQQALHRPV